MRKLNRSKLLGLVTAGAIVVTTAFSFAAWDTLEAKKSDATLSVHKPVTISAPIGTVDFATTSALDVVPEYTQTVSFGVLNAIDGLKFNADVVVKDGTTDVTDKFTIDPSTEQTLSSTDTTADCTVKIIPDDTTLAGKPLTVEITGTLKE